MQPGTWTRTRSVHSPLPLARPLFSNSFCPVSGFCSSILRLRHLVYCISYTSLIVSPSAPGCALLSIIFHSISPNCLLGRSTPSYDKEHPTICRWLCCICSYLCSIYYCWHFSASLNLRIQAYSRKTVWLSFQNRPILIC